MAKIIDLQERRLSRGKVTFDSFLKRHNPIQPVEDMSDEAKEALFRLIDSMVSAVHDFRQDLIVVQTVKKPISLTERTKRAKIKQ